MTDRYSTLFPPVQQQVSAAEWETRVNLAACYRLIDRYGMSDLIYNHITARIPGSDDHLLINLYGLLYKEITASSLVKIDVEGNILSTPDTDYGINKSGYVIHGAIHKARPDVACIIHTHTRAGMAVSSVKSGLLPMTQTSMRFAGHLGYHDYEGVALDLDEQARLIEDLGARMTMILCNHGLLSCGTTVRQAFDYLYYLERACQTQISALAGGSKLRMPPPEVAEKVARQFERPGYQEKKGEWRALLRMLDRTQPSYKQ